MTTVTTRIAMLGTVAAALAAVPAMAQDQSALVGPRVEARLGYDQPGASVPGGGSGRLGKALSFGAEAGYDFAAGSTIAIGPFVQYDRSTIKKCIDLSCYKVSGTLSAGAQVGFAMGDRSQIYVKAAYVSMATRFSNSLGASRRSQTGIGGTLGYEMGFGSRTYARIEASYANLGDIGGVDFDRQHLGIAVGTRF